MDIALNYFMDKLNDKNEHQNIRIKCIQLIKGISNKCNEQQLNEACNSSIDIFTDKNHNTNLRITWNNCNGDWSVRDSCAKSLALSKKWNDKQLGITFQCLIDGFQNINGYDCETSRDLLEGITTKLNEK
ncbi:hypothetical protein RFI_03093 [Reticulomyxa filosa]|uniref:Uncharacterized protein n=1 Tax=Reticulomyxa filosa TaxID=46433 RepID=X6P7G1_RETFI|nr:hypothetical protein RFI_03093 [Reticulomyxa filosa]|eukprot:ETO33999.1 hypothetical protein RFI_03093 [Reticulomyxa filosa]